MPARTRGHGAAEPVLVEDGSDFAVATAVLCFGSAPVLVVASGRWLSAAVWCAIGCAVLLARWVAVDVRSRCPTAGTGRSTG